MKKRFLSIMVVALLLLQAIGCGNPNGEVNPTTEAEDIETIENALSQMQQVNTAQPEVLDDNYRTWYEIFVYSFYDSDGDGIGDIKGVTEKLDYITELGCNGIWLMPVMPSTTYHKYDVTDYLGIDEAYGTMEDFKELVAACHERGIDVIIDFVMNHTSSKHDWFLQASEYLKGLPKGAQPQASECPYVDYYHFSKDMKAGYCELSGTDWYYEAQFWSEMPDVNLGDENVRREFTEIVDYWLNLGVDGFRLDAAKEYYSGTVDANVEVLSWFNEMVKSQKADAYIVAEVWNDMPTYAKYYASGIDSCFDFDFAGADGYIAKTISGKSSAATYGKALEMLEDTIGEYSDTYIDAPFYTNHDMARSAGYYSGEDSEKQTKMAQAMNLLMSGSAFLYYGEELGMKGSGKDENKRAPMYWEMDENAEGMCDGPKDMDSVKMKYESLAEQQQDGNSIYQFVKETIGLRNAYPEIARGTVTFLEDVSNEQICAIQKSYEDETVILVFNLSGEEQEIDFAALQADMGKELKQKGMLLTENTPAVVSEKQLTMPAYSVVLLK